MNQRKLNFEYKNIPRGLIFAFDVVICLMAIVLAYLLRFNFEVPKNEIKDFPVAAAFVLSVRLLGFLLFRTYAGIIRYTSTDDAVKIFLSVFLGSILFSITNVVFYFFINEAYIVPFSIIIIEFTLTVFALTSYRLLVKIAYLELRNPSKAKKKVVIYGAGESGFITKRALDRDVGTKYKVVAFIDDDSKKISKRLEGVRIFSPENFEFLLKTQNVEHLIIAIQDLPATRKNEIIEISLNYDVDLMTVPPVSKWINGELSFKQIKNVKIEDLLERDVISLDDSEIRSQLFGKCVLITGAAGSIGSEIVRQVAQKKPSKIVLFDNAETPLFHIDLELSKNKAKVNYEIVVGDIRSKERMYNVFRTFKPDAIYHAAAYKHVPLMEDNPAEAIITNIHGTKTIADLAVEFRTEKFVMVSTDKAVNPTSIMGASKRLAEIYTQSLNSLNITKFITTRFGNVLGSNGSVIPLFRKQIENGGPITVTHPDVNRFFMTIPEACQLVLEAGAMGNGGEIFIFDMGKSVKIVDLAKKMIRLSGLTLGKDIQIVFTGLRPGEKLYEELLNTEENTLPTHHPRIMIAKVKEHDLKTVKNEFSDLIQLAELQDNFKIVEKMKSIVPEYQSNNSIYEVIDKKQSKKQATGNQ